MKATMTVLLLALVGSAMAQSAPPSQTVAPKKPAAMTKTAPAKTSAKPAATSPKAAPKKPAAMMKKMPMQTAAKPASATMQKPAATMKPAMKPVKKPAMKPAMKPAVSKAKAAMPFAKPMPTKAVKKAPEPAPVKPAAEKTSTAGKRDPFVSPVVERAGGVIGPPCETGKKCLAIGSVVLRGIVKAPAGMIAVVENNRRATYFLHENDPVFNGYVVRITPDSVVFRENILDAAGKTSTHDVVKKMAAPAV